MHTHVPAAGATMTSRRVPGHLVIALHGELDVASTTALREALLVALHRSAGTPVIIDLSEVSFCDAAGLALLVGADRRARLQGHPLALAAPRPQMSRLLHVTGLDHAFTVHATLADARQSRARAVRSLMV
ncbi:STAS domain-containing protein [Thermomonospora umbrina]|uniref:Anti-sigma factor antagonist n=1 Tax=Thermomonospora umbrina TaxID=111806 RepID=A0A3D9SVW1_9ACTN|nr:STAS domain-containing protein [Thermomonospora umbrina]REE96714.1 anti-sigma B factor antagonist [Thermomonospora umbrina]